MSVLPRTQAVLLEACQRGAFPAAQAHIVHRGEAVLDLALGEATRERPFDLASLTKILCTTALFVRLWAKGEVGPSTALRRFFPDAPVAQGDVTLADLLYHRSGLPAWAPFFAPVVRAVPELVAADCPAATRAAVREEVVRAAAAVVPTWEPRSHSVYSDVGFILLGEALAMAGGAPLDALFADLVAVPLGLDLRFTRLSRDARPDALPTGKTRPREPAPGQEGMWEPFPPWSSRPGEVDDDNAYVMDGVAGHAGLFGTATAAARFGQLVLEELAGAGRLAPAPLWRKLLELDPTVPGSTRRMGFDTQSRGPVSLVGHLGFTGTSLWIDAEDGLVVALCTNRTYNGRASTGIREVRARFHDAVLEELGRAPPADAHG